MNESPKEPVMDKPVKPSAGKQHGFGVIELLFAASTIAATIAAVPITSPKIPKSYGD